MTQYRLTLLLVIALGIFAWLFVRQKRLLNKLSQLAEEAEKSRQQADAEQLRNKQLKQEMTNNIAHELKTPVSSIRGYLEILLGDKPIDEEKKKFFLERCYSQTLRLSDLIRDVSLINKLEESSDLFPKGIISVAQVADEAILELQDKAESQRITIHNRLDQETLIEGNHSLLYAIFRNLIENSIAYAGEDIAIGIECYREDEERFYLRYYDTGCGVANDYLPKLFDRFVRIDEGRSRKNGGTGLGLSIVKHAVQFHGGDIYAKNGEECGLEYFFSLKKENE